MKLPISDIKSYIIDSRKKGYTDEVITQSLKEAKWPDDIIQSALQEANNIVPPVTETKQTKEQQIEQSQEQKTQPETQATANVPQEKKQPDDLFTKPPLEEQPKKQEPKKEKKGFSFLSLVALLLSPIPIIGLAVAMATLDHVRKNKMKGTLICLFALIINIAVTGYILWLIFQIFTLNPGQLTGLSKYINDKFNLV